MPIDPREAKLPQWVRDELYRLRALIIQQDSQLSVANRAAPSEGATGKVIVGAMGRDSFPLHDRAMVVFTLPGGGKVSCMLRGEGDKTILDLNCNGGALHVMPRASNSAWVKVMRD